jgi:hypothetical protein
MLSEYNFEIRHIKGTANWQVDALSRRPDYDQGQNDNQDVTVLPEQVFIKALEVINNYTKCYGRLAVVSDVDDGGFALNVDKRVERICHAITKQVQRSDARIEVDVMHTRNECTE